MYNVKRLKINFDFFLVLRLITSIFVLAASSTTLSNQKHK